MKASCLLFSVIPLGLLAACSSIPVKRDMDPYARFGQYKTYAWAPEPATQASVSPAVDQAIRAAVERNLTGKGFKRVQARTPDLYVVYHITSVQNAGSADYTDWGLAAGYRPGAGSYRAWTGRPATSAMIAQNKSGALILDMVGVRREQLDWRGVAACDLGKGGSEAARAEEAVRLLLLDFPPPLPPAR